MHEGEGAERTPAAAVTITLRSASLPSCPGQGSLKARAQQDCTGGMRASAHQAGIPDCIVVTHMNSGTNLHILRCTHGTHNGPE